MSPGGDGVSAAHSNGSSSCCNGSIGGRGSDSSSGGNSGGNGSAVGGGGSGRSSGNGSGCGGKPGPSAAATLGAGAGVPSLDGRLAYAITAVARELGLQEAAVAERVELLRHVLPDGGLGDAMPPGAQATEMVRLALRADAAAASMLVLREELPRANASAAVARHPYLLSLAPEDLRASTREFKRLLLEHGGSDPDALAQAAPLLLEPGVLAGVLSEVHRQLGGRSPPGQLLQRAPHLALSCQAPGARSHGDSDVDHLRRVFGGGVSGLVSGSGMGGGSWI